MALAYAIVAIGAASAGAYNPSNLAYLALIAAPLAFILITEKCSDPNNVVRETD